MKNRTMDDVQDIYLCIDHITHFQISMRKMGHQVSVPRLVVGEERSCAVCGQCSGPNPDDIYIFRTHIRSAFDTELIEQQFRLLDRLMEEGFQLSDAMQVVSAMDFPEAGDE